LLPPCEAGGIEGGLALARLAARTDEAELRERIEAVLRAALPAEAAAAALVRLTISRAVDKDFDPTALLSSLAGDVPDPTALLAALLRAGTDNDPWDDYHERVVAVIRELVQGGDVLLSSLLTALESALRGEDWPSKRIALAAVAACAQVMPDALNVALPRAELEDLLVQGLQDAGSYNSRRFAVTALSHLRTATPAAVAALLTASRDVAIVQEDAVKAAGRFQHLSPDFTQEESLAPLAAALTGESTATAYVAARLLAALGSAPAVIEIPGLRRRIAQLLSEALRHEGAGRDVYLLSGDKIDHQGTLSQVLFDALVQVAGLPE
ncbi:MAG: hypothetical protein H5T62_09535, partial [Anaerolineae bacterium]|nr:hypothetical protein [Anaerolineae bacterium]